VSDRRIHSNAFIVTEDLTNKVVAWATETPVTRRSFLQDRRATTICASVVASWWRARKPKARHCVMPRLWPMPASTRRAGL
jgi:hypothetical protein